MIDLTKRNEKENKVDCKEQSQKDIDVLIDWFNFKETK